MAQLAMHRPLDEGDLDDDVWLYPVGAQPGQAGSLREGSRVHLERVQPGAQFEQQLRIESGPDLAGEGEIVAVVIADHQRTQADASPLRIREAADHELLRELALHLQPVPGASMLVWRATPFRDDAFPAFASRPLPWFGILDEIDVPQRRFKGKLLQQRPTLFEYQSCHQPAVEPEDVEDVVAGAAIPCHLAIEDSAVDRQLCDRVGDRWEVLRQTVA